MIEWAVVENSFRAVKIVKGGLGSRAEAEAWLTALALSDGRVAREMLFDSDMGFPPRTLWVAWRRVDGWRTDDPPDTE